MQSNSNLTQSQRVDGGLIVRKTTLIKMNTKPIDDVYERSSKVSQSAAFSRVIPITLSPKISLFLTFN